MFLPDDTAAVTARGTIHGMRTTIDNAGRVVIPKELRAALNLIGGDEVEITLEGERIELTPAFRKVRLRRSPNGLLTSDLRLPPGHGPEEDREALERARR
jgi:AbrB family looped-hinge helix DNA binding protein